MMDWEMVRSAWMRMVKELAVTEGWEEGEAVASGRREMGGRRRTFRMKWREEDGGDSVEEVEEVD
jgi:hypothetical protein